MIDTLLPDSYIIPPFKGVTTIRDILKSSVNDGFALFGFRFTMRLLTLVFLGISSWAAQPDSQQGPNDSSEEENFYDSLEYLVETSSTTETAVEEQGDLKPEEKAKENLIPSAPLWAIPDEHPHYRPSIARSHSLPSKDSRTRIPQPARPIEDLKTHLSDSQGSSKTLEKLLRSIDRKSMKIHDRLILLRRRNIRGQTRKVREAAASLKKLSVQRKNLLKVRQEFSAHSAELSNKLIDENKRLRNRIREDENQRLKGVQPGEQDKRVDKFISQTTWLIIALGIAVPVLAFVVIIGCPQPTGLEISGSVYSHNHE